MTVGGVLNSRTRGSYLLWGCLVACLILADVVRAQEASAAPEVEVEASESAPPARPQVRQRPRPSGGGFGTFLSGLLGSITRTADVDGCPGKCVHSIASLICDEVLEDISCPTPSMKCCVERNGGMPPTPSSKDDNKQDKLEEKIDIESDDSESKDDSSVEKDEKEKEEDEEAEENKKENNNSKKKRRKKKKDKSTTSTTTTTETSTTEETTSASDNSSKESEDYDDPDYEYTSPGNSSDSSRFHQPIPILVLTAAIAQLAAL